MSGLRSRAAGGRRLGRTVTVTVTVAAAAVVAGSATGVLAAPASAPVAEVVVNESLQPVLHGQATATGTGAQSITFSARTVGSATWDLLDNVAVAGTDAYTQLPGGRLSIGQRFEYQTAHCDDTGCTSSAIKRLFTIEGVVDS
ncbi:hypothetical protein [Blastococcus capsensis]|uniref:hypothetical protein n=1 Tax=Blastococcus capsensis TaxID=1564163 RepID=UPI00253F6596|nr:hypothetical protein [Blastococcus capsensis]MDK3258651.1 hypothetical protein [Blastococcus capsensis]